MRYAKSIFSILVTLWVPAVSLAATDYRVSCRVDDGFAMVIARTDGYPVSFEGDLRILLYDRDGRSVGRTSTSIDQRVQSDAKVYLAQEPVDWYVDSCSADIRGIEVAVQYPRTSQVQQVYVQRSPVVIEPRVVIGLPFPRLFAPPFLQSREVVHVSRHVHSHGCGHHIRETSVTYGRGRRPGRVVVTQSSSFPEY